MKIIITGASGVVGRDLVPAFLARGAQLLLVGREPSRLAKLFPSVECTSYAELTQHAKGYDGLLHLAVLNNNVAASAEEFVHANTDLTASLVDIAKQAGIARFVYMSTTQALDDRNRSSYATSKRTASNAVLAAQGVETRVIYPSAIVGDQLNGRLALLNAASPSLRKGLLELYSAITPVADHAAVATACWNALNAPDFPQQTVVSRDQSKNSAFLWIKRCTDVLVALAILVPFCWLLVAIWLAVKLQSRGPGIFAQERVGQDGRIFTCFKFRTMAQDSPNVGTHEASTSLVTPLGKVLRSTKLDELPQAINILLNQMSLVGPRPSLPNQAQVISEREKLGVLTVKPGITGLAQVKKVDMSQPATLAQWDAQYVQLRSLRLDLSIALQTLRGKGGGDAMAP
ncbi:sugar transferase [Devosia sp.]|uniref:sugar transferase n=1 Tax=Devosia sp. TaxID=1871048 RepID=UPI001AD4532E|nr:sugar transferase [Devosia sp.]MBN9332109.1 sugar transferase [Devosia sp.]